MVGAAIHEAYAPTMPGRTLGYMVNLIAEDSGHNYKQQFPNTTTRGPCRLRLAESALGESAVVRRRKGTCPFGLLRDEITLGY